MQCLRNRFAAMMALALVPAALTACDDDDPTGPDLLTTADLAGDFDAESAVFTDVDDPTRTVPVVATGGELTLDLDETGTFTTTLRRPGFDDVVRTGVMTVDGDRLRIEEPGFDARMADFTFDDATGTLTVTDTGDRFAFEDGAMVGAESEVAFKRTANR